MNVGDLFAKLSVGEFSNLSLSMEGSGQIAENKIAAVTSYANEGLLDLHSRFVLNEKSVVLQLIEGRTNYYLMKRFAMSQSAPGGPDPRYINDTLEPFEEDVIKILYVHNRHAARMVLNDQSDRCSLFTPRYNQLQVPFPKQDEPIEVFYQAKHRELEPGVMEADIYLPDVLVEPLRYYIAGRVYSDMNGAENSTKGQEFMAKYESKCALTVDRDLLNNTPDNSSEIFTRNGWI